MGNPLQDSVRTRPIPLVDGDLDPSAIPTDTAADVNPLQASVRTPSYSRTADILAAENANPNAVLRYPSGKTVAETGVQIGSNPNNQRATAVGTKRVHDVWGSRDVPVDANGNEVGIFSAKVPAFSKADYDASPKATREAQSEFHRDTPAEQADVAKSQEIITHPGASAQPTTEVSPPAPPMSALDRMFADAMKGGGGGAGGPRFDPYANRNAAYERALKDAELVRDMRTDAGTFAADQLGKEANAMGRYAREAEARGESQSKEARGREAAFVREAEAAAGDKINPNHYKETRSTLQAGLDILASAFGGLAAGARGGGPNRGLDNLQNKINADIQAQKDNHEIKVEGVKAKQTAYGMMLDRFHNDQVAAHMAQADELQKWRALGDARAALEKNVEAQDEWAKTRSAIDERIATNEDQAAMAARQGEPDVLPRLERYYKLRQAQSNIAHTDAETAKLNREGTGEGAGLTPEQRGQEVMAKKEVDANLAALDGFKRDANTIAKGTSLGGAAAEHLPSAIPGVSEAKKNASARGSYNDYVMGAVGAAYRLQTGSPEPKNMELLSEEARPFLATPSDSPEDIRNKAEGLRQHLLRAGASKGVTNPLQDSLRSKPMPRPATLSVVPGT